MMYAYVGCRTSAWRGARGKGIEVYQVLPSGEWRLIQRVESVQENPSWLTLDPLRDRLYALHGDGDVVAVWKRNQESGLLSLLTQQTTGPRHAHPDLDPQRRNNPVGAALTPDGQHLLIANHEGGNIAALAIDEQGLQPPHSLARIPGHPATPESLSRPHEIVFAPNSDLFAVPIQGRAAGNGIDMIRLYRWHKGEAWLLDEIRLAPGSWPRHVDFHPSGKWLYCLSELSSTLTVLEVDAQRGALRLKQTLSALPEGYLTRSDASEIEVHPSGRFVYAANRGHDSIGVFAVDARDGTLSVIDWVECGGKTPRFTTLSPDGRSFFSANEESDTIQAFDVDLQTGRLHKRQQTIVTPSPTCICFASAD
ncbi:lactonase family protein [Pantoea sp. FDAARGOS_194]|uniref:lactonase family protein n=1 Tax=Pantoea TaxID=53335 RepID=UPI000BB5983A|nr:MULTISPECIES: lactonase family protein [Pantoea]PNK70422.1 lactonase family protein [Pantoea sp. FDAARGOS_194]